MGMDDDSDAMSEDEVSIDEKEISDQGSELKESEEENVDNDDSEDGLDASATDSDEEADLDANATDSDESKLNEKGKSKSEQVKEQIFQRYQERQGKQLYIRFPHKVPETQESLEAKVKELTPLAVKVHKPRQRHVRFCLVDFATNEDRDATLNMLRKSIKKGELKKYAVNIPRTESSDFVKELADRKIKSIENKKAKQRLKRATKKALIANNFTSTIVVLNLPKNVSILQMRELFPNAVDVNIKPCKTNKYKDTSIAAVTFPTTMDARTHVRKKKVSLGGNELVIKFDNTKSFKKSKNTMKTNDLSQSEPAKKQAKPSETLNTRTKITNVPLKKVEKKKMQLKKSK